MRSIKICLVSEQTLPKKISALQQDFGLRVEGFLVSPARNILSKTGEINENILKRAKHCNTRVIHPNDIGNIGMFIKNYVKGLN